MFQLWGCRDYFSATFHGFRKAGSEKPFRALLFKNVVHEPTGDEVAAHTWIPCFEFDHLMKYGQRVSFQARVRQYDKSIGDLPLMDFGFHQCTHFWTFPEHSNN